MRAVIDYFKKAYSGGLLKQGKMAVHEAKELYVSLSDKKTSRVILDTDTNWLSPTLLNSWEEYDETPSFRRNSVGVIHFKGTVQYGTCGTAIFQLPESFRPARNIAKVVTMDDTFVTIDINTNGYVTPRGTTEPAYISLETSFIS